MKASTNILIAVSFFILAAWGGYWYREYLKRGQDVQQLELRERELREALARKDTDLKNYEDSVWKYSQKVEQSDKIIRELERQVAILQETKIEDLVAIKFLTPIEQVDLFNDLTGEGSRAVLVEETTDTLMLTPIHRVESANTSMINERNLLFEVNLMSKIIDAQHHRITYSQGVITNQQGMITTLTETNVLYRQENENLRELLIAYRQEHRKEKWYYTTGGAVVGFIAGILKN